MDVREKVQFELCSLSRSLNVPFSELIALKPAAVKETMALTNETAPSMNGGPAPEWLQQLIALPSEETIHVVCRLGNDSQVAVRKLKDLGLVAASRKVVDVKGGLQAWREEIDPGFPEY